MKFSVIVPTYNRRQLLEKCLGGILAQTYADAYETIVVDDGSTDGTREYLRSLDFKNFRVFWQEHSGPAKARNLGAQKAVGDLLAFTDDDCLPPADWLHRLESGFNAWSEAGAVGGYLEAPSEILKLNPLAQLEFLETHHIYKAGEKECVGGFESPAGGTNNIAYRCEVFSKLGGFDENFPVPAGEDADLKLRAVEAGYKIGYVPVKMTHLDPYNLKSFLRRGIASGIGSAYFERKNFGRIDHRLSLLISFLRSLFRLPVFVLTGRRPSDWRLRLLVSLKELLMIYGRWQAKRSRIRVAPAAGSGIWDSI